MKTLLILIFLTVFGFAAEPKPDIAPLITATTWFYDHPTKRNATLRFYPNGTVVSGSGWKGVWKRLDAKTVELWLSDKRTCVLTFNESFTAFSGTFFDKLAVTGRRNGDVPASAK